MTPSTPSVILLPGLACDAEVWAEVQPALPLPSAVADVHFRHPTLPSMAAALLAEHPGPLVLIGHSMGAMIAMEAARRAPERIAALAVLASTARPDTPELVRLRSEACELFAAGRIDEVLRANVPFAFAPASLARDPGLVGRYTALVRRAGAAALIAQNRAVMAREDLRPHLGAIRGPLLVICGEADGLTPPEHAEEIAAAVPQAELHRLADCGHMVTLEQPARVAARLSDWLQRGPARAIADRRHVGPAGDRDATAP